MTSPSFFSMTTYTNLQTKIQQDLRNRSDLATIITDEIQSQIIRYQNESFGSQEATDTSINTIAGTAAYTLPTSIIHVTGAWFLYAGNTWLQLPRVDWVYLNT